MQRLETRLSIGVFTRKFARGLRFGSWLRASTNYEKSDFRPTRHLHGDFGV